MSRVDGRVSETVASFLYEETLTPSEKSSLQNLISLGTENNVQFSSVSALSLSSNSLLVASGPITESKSLTLTQTWNNAAVTFTGLQVNVTDTASSIGSALMDLRAGGVSRASILKSGALLVQFANIGGVNSTAGADIGYIRSGISLGASGPLSWCPTNLSSIPDTILLRDAAGTLAQRNGTSAQASRLYNTFTGTTNFERLNFLWDANVAKIGTEKGSAGGVARDLVIETDGTERARFTAAGVFSVDGVTFGRGGGAIATNTAVGAGCLAANSTGLECVAVGSTSLAANTTGNRNVSLGAAALNKNTSGNDNCAGGVFALFNNVTGNENVAFGNRAMIVSTGANNTAIGHQSLTEITAGNLNFGAGWRSGRYIADGVTANTNSQSSCFIGANTRALASGQSNQIVIGHDAIGLGSNTAVLGNDSIITTALKGNVVIHRGTQDAVNFERLGLRWDVLDAKIGTTKGGSAFPRDLVFETDGTERVRITASGVFSVDGVTFGRGGGGVSTNTAVGSGAMAANTTGVQNTAVGQNALSSHTTGTGNVAVGRSALAANTTSNSNVAIGAAALVLNVTGGTNVAIGQNALGNNTTGSTNTAVGNIAGRFIADGTTANSVTTNSVYIGANTKALASGQTNHIVIGYDATGLGSNTAVLGNDSITLTALKGSVAIGATTAASKLTVTGGDIETATIGTGIILKSPNGTRWRVTIDDAGTLVRTNLTPP